MSPVRVQPGDDVIFQPLHDEIVLLNMSNQEYFGLDDVGAAMWKLLVEHGDLETVADRMVAEYDVDRNTVRKDLGILVERLLAAGLLRDAGPTPVDAQPNV
jgi:hypothetical protein